MKRLLKSSLVLLSLTGAQYLYDWGPINTAKADPTNKGGSEVAGQGRIENSGNAFVGSEINLTGPTKLQFADYEDDTYTFDEFKNSTAYTEKYDAAIGGYYTKADDGTGEGKESSTPYTSLGTQSRKLDATTLKGITGGKTKTVTVLTNSDGTLNTIGQRLFGKGQGDIDSAGIKITVTGDTKIKIGTDSTGYDKTAIGGAAITAKNGHRIVAKDIQIATYTAPASAGGAATYTLTDFGKTLFGADGDVTVDLGKGTVKVAANQVLKKYGSAWFYDDAKPATNDYSSSAIFKINEQENEEDEDKGVAAKGIYIDQAVLAQMDEDGTLKYTADAGIILRSPGLAGKEKTIPDHGADKVIKETIGGTDTEVFKSVNGKWEAQHGFRGLSVEENIPHVTIAKDQVIEKDDNLTDIGRVLLNVEDQANDDLSDTTTRLVLSDDTGRMPDETKRYFIEKLGLVEEEGSWRIQQDGAIYKKQVGTILLTDKGLEIIKNLPQIFGITQDNEIKFKQTEEAQKWYETYGRPDTFGEWDDVKEQVLGANESGDWKLEKVFTGDKTLVSVLNKTMGSPSGSTTMIDAEIIDEQGRFNPYAFNIAFPDAKLYTSKMYQVGNTYEYDLKVATYSAKINDFGKDYFAWVNKKVNDEYSVDTNVNEVEGHTSGDLHNYGTLHVFSNGSFEGAGTVYNYGQWKAIDSVTDGATDPNTLNLPTLENLTGDGGKLTGDGYAADATDKSLAREEYDYSKLSADELKNAAAYFDLYNDSGIREFRDHSMAEVRFYDKPYADQYQESGTLPENVGETAQAQHEGAAADDEITLKAIIKTDADYGDGTTQVGERGDTVKSRMPNFKDIDEELDPYKTNEQVAYDLTEQMQLDVKVTKRALATDQFVKGAFFTQKGLPTSNESPTYGKGDAIAKIKYSDGTVHDIYESTEGNTQKIIQAAEAADSDVKAYRESVITTNSDFETFPEMGDSGTGATWNDGDPVVTYTGDNSYFNGTFELKDGGAILAQAGTMFGGETILHQGTEFEWHGGPKDGLNRPHIKLQPFSTLYFNLNGENQDDHVDTETTNKETNIFSFYGTLEHAPFDVNEKGQIATQYTSDGTTPTDEVYYTNGTEYKSKADYDALAAADKTGYELSWYYSEEAPSYYVDADGNITNDQSLASKDEHNQPLFATKDQITQTSRIVFESGKILIKGDVSGFEGNVYVGPAAGFEARIQEAVTDEDYSGGVANIYKGKLFSGHVYQDATNTTFSIGTDGTLNTANAAIFDSEQMTDVRMKNGYSILHNNTEAGATVVLDNADLDRDAVLEIQGNSEVKNMTIRGTMILNGDSTQTDTTIEGGVLVLGGGSTLTTHNMRVGSTVVMWNGKLDNAYKVRVDGEGGDGLVVKDNHTMKIFIDVDPSQDDGQNADMISAPTRVTAGVDDVNKINIGGLNFLTYDMTADEYLFTVLTGGAQDSAKITIGAEYEANNPTFVAYENAGFTTKAGGTDLGEDNVYQYTANKTPLNVERQADGSYIIYFSNGAEYQLFGSHGDNGAGAGKIKLVALGSGYLPIDVMHTAGLGNTADLFQRITSEWGFDEKTETERHFWNRSFIGRTTHAAKTGYSDLKSNDYGTVFGYDWKDTKLQRANAKFYPSLFASVTHSNFKGSDQSARQETYALGAKGTWYNTKFKLDMMGTYEFLNTHSNSVENGRKVKSHIGGFGIKGAYNLFEKRGYTLRPEFLVDYSYINTKDVKISDTRKLKFKNINRFDIVPGLSLLQEIGTWKNALSFKYHQKLGGKAKVIAKTDKVVNLDELKKSHFEASVDINKLNEKSKLGIQLSKTFGGLKGLKGTVKFGYRFQ